MQHGGVHETTLWPISLLFSCREQSKPYLPCSNLLGGYLRDWFLFHLTENSDGEICIAGISGSEKLWEAVGTACESRKGLQTRNQRGQKIMGRVIIEHLRYWEEAWERKVILKHICIWGMGKRTHRNVEWGMARKDVRRFYTLEPGWSQGSEHALLTNEILP